MEIQIDGLITGEARIRELLVGKDPFDPSPDGEGIWEWVYPGKARLYAEGRAPPDGRVDRQ